MPLITFNIIIIIINNKIATTIRSSRTRCWCHRRHPHCLYSPTVLHSVVTVLFTTNCVCVFTKETRENGSEWRKEEKTIENLNQISFNAIDFFHYFFCATFSLPTAPANSIVRWHSKLLLSHQHSFTMQYFHTRNIYSYCSNVEWNINSLFQIIEFFFIVKFLFFSSISPKKSNNKKITQNRKKKPY